MKAPKKANNACQKTLRRRFFEHKNKKASKKAPLLKPFMQKTVAFP